MYNILRRVAGFLFAPLDALFVSVRSIGRYAQAYLNDDKPDFGDLKKYFRGTRLCSRSGALIGFTAGFTVALFCPLPGTLPAYLTTVGGIYLLAFTLGYACSLAGRFLGAVTGYLIDQCIRNKSARTSAKENMTSKSIINKVIKGATYVIAIGLFGDKAALETSLCTPPPESVVAGERTRQAARLDVDSYIKTPPKTDTGDNDSLTPAQASSVDEEQANTSCFSCFFR